jgi:antirestriction protein ArdC
MSTTATRDVYQLVTNQIISTLEKGVIPWRQPWANVGQPQNLITGKYYRGINSFLLSALQFEYNFYLTYNQVQKLGGRVKKGEKANLVIFTKMIEKKTEDTKKPDYIPFLRYYWVFNVAQCEGIEHKLPEPFVRAFAPIPECLRIIERMPALPDIRHHGDEAYYHPKHDFINVPKPERFDTNENYYATLFHELVHSTGHAGRLGRSGVTESAPFGGDLYSNEELIAELGACYLCSFAGIDYKPIDNHAAYIHHWLRRLQGDNRLIIKAAAQAQKAVDYILNTKAETYEQSEAA